MASGSKHPPGRGGNGSADSKVRRTQSRKPTMLNVPQEEEATLLVGRQRARPHPTRRQRDRDPQPSRRPPL